MRSTFADRADLQPTRRPRLPPVGSANSRPCARNSVANTADRAASARH